MLKISYNLHIKLKAAGLPDASDDLPLPIRQLPVPEHPCLSGASLYQLFSLIKKLSPHNEEDLQIYNFPLPDNKAWLLPPPPATLFQPSSSPLSLSNERQR